MKTLNFFKHVCVMVMIVASCFVTGCQKEDTMMENDNMEYIDIPEIESNELCFMDNAINKKYSEAMRRFDARMDLENGYIKVTITNGEEIGISEQLFKIFDDVCMQTNQDVKEGKYQLTKRDGYIVTVKDVKTTYPILKDSNEDGGTTWSPINMNQSSQNLGMVLLSAMRYYWQNRNSKGTINQLINMSTGNFSRSTYMRSGTFTYGEYTYTRTVNGTCQANNMPDDCIWSNIQTDYYKDYETTGGRVVLKDNDGGHIFSIQSPQSGSYIPLSAYCF
jgi:hypothetical protein